MNETMDNRLRPTVPVLTSQPTISGRIYKFANPVQSLGAGCGKRDVKATEGKAQDVVERSRVLELVQHREIMAKNQTGNVFSQHGAVPYMSKALESEVMVLEAKFRHRNPFVDDCGEDFEEEEAGKEVKAKRKQMQLSFDPRYAFSCIEAMDAISTSEEMNPELGALLSRIGKICKLALYREEEYSLENEFEQDGDEKRNKDKDKNGDISGQKQFYCEKAVALHHEIASVEEQCRSLQAEVGVVRNQYVQQVNEYRDLESRMEQLLTQFYRKSREKELVEEEVNTVQEDLNAELSKHERLGQQLEELSRNANRKTTKLFEVSSNRKNLRLDLLNAKQKLENFRAEIALTDGKVPKRKLVEALDDISYVRDMLAKRETSLQAKQMEYVERLNEIKRIEEQLKQVRSQYNQMVAEEEELKRSLTPRPDWEAGVGACPWLVMKERPISPTNLRGRRSTKKLLRSTTLVRKSSKSLIGIQGSSKNLLALSASGKQQSLSMIRNASIRSLKRGSTRRMSLADVTKSMRKKLKKGKHSLRPTRESVTLLAKLIKEKNLDGPKLMEANARLERVQTELRETQQKVEQARKYAQATNEGGAGALFANGSTFTFKSAAAAISFARSSQLFASNPINGGTSSAAAIAAASSGGDNKGMAGSVLALLKKSKEASVDGNEGGDSLVEQHKSKYPLDSNVDVWAVPELRGEPAENHWRFVKFQFSTTKKHEIQIKCLGRGPKVPAFLKADGKLVLRLIPRNDLLELIKEVWAFKLSKDQVTLKDTKSSKIGVAAALYQILKNRYGLQSVVAKWGYNILYSLDKYQDDPDCHMFYMCLTRQVPELTYIDQQTMLDVLRSFLKKVSQLESGGHLGEISKTTLMLCLEQLFPNKTEEDIDELEMAINEEQPMSVVFVDLLLEPPERDMTQPNLFPSFEDSDTFINLIKKQHLREIAEAYKELKDRLLLAASMYQSVDKCKLEDVITTLRKIDEAIEPAVIQHYLKMMFPKKIKTKSEAEYTMKNNMFKGENSSPDEMVSIPDILANLSTDCYKPSDNYLANPKPAFSEEHQNLINQFKSMMG